jgi:gluconolactonase
MNPVIKYDPNDIVQIWDVDHPESISVGPGGEAYTTGTAGQVYRLDLEQNKAQQFASTAPRRVLGQAVDADGTLYCADAKCGKVVRITQSGEELPYATGPGGVPFMCTNYPAFDRQGNLYVSDSGDWSDEINGHMYKIPPGGGEAQLWFPEPINTPNAIALDAEEEFLYFVETWGSSISRIAIRKDGSAGPLERVLHLPRHVPDGLALDEDGRVWIACHRPDSIKVFDPRTKQLDIFCEDWRGNMLRSPTDAAFVGPQLETLLVATLGNLCVHRFDNFGVRGMKLNHPKL